MANRVAYDRVLLLDLYPGPNYPHVTVVSFHKTGIPVALLESAKLTRELRMAARDLPIYPDPGHEYYIVAKMEVKCDRTEEARAVRAVNEFVQELLRAGRDLHDLQEEIVDNFKGRVQHLIPYVRKDERDEQRTFKSSSRRREAISSSDPEGTPAAKAAKLGQIRKGTTSAANVAKKQNRVEKATPKPRSLGLPRVATPALEQEQEERGYQDLADEHPILQPSPEHHSSQHTIFKTPSRHGSDSQRSSGQAASGPSPADLSVTVTKCLSPVVEKFEALNSKVDRTHAKLATGLRVNVTLLEKMGKDLAEMKEAVKALTGTSAVLKAQKLEHMFPLKTTAEVDRYLKDDPEAALAMERLSQVDFSEKSYARQMLLSVLDEGLFAMTYTWPSDCNHASDKDVLPEQLKKAFLAVARLTLNTPGRRMTVAEFTAGVRNQFSGNRLRYVRKMTKLLNAGKLPAHVDPSAIINAPPSKMPRIGPAKANDTGDAHVSDAEDALAANDGPTPDLDPDDPRVEDDAPADSAVPEGNNEAEEEVHDDDVSKPSRGVAFQDSDSDMSSLDDIISNSSESNSGVDCVRSSSPSCDARQDYQ